MNGIFSEETFYQLYLIATDLASSEHDSQGPHYHRVYNEEHELIIDPNQLVTLETAQRNYHRILFSLLCLYEDTKITKNPQNLINMLTYYLHDTNYYQSDDFK